MLKLDLLKLAIWFYLLEVWIYTYKYKYYALLNILFINIVNKIKPVSSKLAKCNLLFKFSANFELHKHSKQILYYFFLAWLVELNTHGLYKSL